MERTIFLQHYRVCLKSDGTPREINRDGAAITYEAADERTREAVDLKLIPLESLEPGVREQLEEQARLAQSLRRWQRVDHVAHRTQADNQQTVDLRTAFCRHDQGFLGDSRERRISLVE